MYFFFFSHPLLFSSLIATAFPTLSQRFSQPSFSLLKYLLLQISKEYVRAFFPKLKIHSDIYFDEVDTSIKDADTTIKEIFKDFH